MTEIEFLDPGASTEPTAGADGSADDERAAPDLRQLVPALAAAVCWLLSAGLAVMASLSTVYRLVYEGGGQHQTISVNAWGRFSTGQLAQALGHQTRYAIVAIAAAVLLMAAAIVAIARLAIARYLAIAGTAVAAALAATLLLFVEATRSTNSTRAEQLATNFRLRTETGSAVWLILAAAAAATLGVVLAFVLKAPEPDVPDAPDATDARDGLGDLPTSVEGLNGGAGPTAG